MELSPNGKTLKPRSRFSKFVNLPELQMMFRQFADVQTAEMLNLPRPKLASQLESVEDAHCAARLPCTSMGGHLY
jgi:N12 class adenine-specific DNA methylase